MFTGLVEEVGRLEVRRPSAGGGARLEVTAETVREGLALGDSIAVNGTCLTAVEWGDGWIAFDAVAETLEKTTLRDLPIGRAVNLERALEVGARVGGHYVTGHVDGQGALMALTPSGNGVVYRFSAPRELMPMIAAKGSIAIDGISLTVVEVTQTDFTVWIVPHTLEATALKTLELGYPVNLEVDILAKYVQRALSSRGGGIGYDTLQKAGFYE